MNLNTTIKSLVSIGLALSMGLGSVSAQTFNEWQDPETNEINRAPMHTSFFAFANEEEAAAAVREKSRNYLSLHGMWKFNWVKNADQRPTDFWGVDYDDSSWGEMPVPGVWELNGYGDPIYVNVGYAWREHYENRPPYVPVEENHVGTYRREITVPAEWKGKEIIAHFGSVTSNMYLWINGKFVGYSEDSKLEAEFDVTKYLKPGKNTFAMQVFRWCDGTYLEDQDFFRYSGIARDSYLYAREKTGIRDIRITPDLDKDYRDGSLEVAVKTSGKCDVRLALTDAAGMEVAAATLSGKGVLKTVFRLANPAKWTAETPNLYTLSATSFVKGKEGETIRIKAGFRKIEIADSQVLINGQPVIFKGVNRHELDPDGGYVMSYERMEQDIRIMKEMNVNGLRTCHYPDDYRIYELCDKYGIYMVAEANIESHGLGYGDKTLAKEPAYNKAHLERDMRHVQRNYNFPSIIFWSLGNEAGDGQNFVDCYNWIKNEDKTRPVQYERAEHNDHTDIFCPMYYDYRNCIKYCESNPAKPLIQCEYAHAMGNSQGGFMEYMELVRKYPNYQGGFIWDFVDQSPRIKGKKGVDIYGYTGDWNDYDSKADFNFCNNGLIGPDRRLNPHAYEVAYGYQSILTAAADLSKGTVEVYNENFFRDLSAYYMEWTILADGKPIRKGIVSSLDVPAQQTRTIGLGYDTASLPQNKELLLNVEYRLKAAEGLLDAGRRVAYEQLAISSYGFETPEQTRCNLLGFNEADKSVCGKDFRVTFDEEGFLCGIEYKGSQLFAPGSCLRPNFWRPVTDNDFGAKLQEKFAAWRNPGLELTSFSHRNIDGLVEVSAAYDMTEVGAKLFLNYLIGADGTVKVSQKMLAGDNKASDMFRFGMRMEMPENYNAVKYYGRGPWENYTDRKASAMLGIYSQTVAEQFYPYIRPQDTGLKSDIRWYSVLNLRGNGLKFTSNAPFYASALEYTIESLDEGLQKHNTHSEEVEKAGKTCICIDGAHYGLGCVCSWGTLPLPEYRLPYGDMEFTFTISPVTNQF